MSASSGRSRHPRPLRVLLAGFGILLVLAAGYALWWHHLAQTARSALDHWLAERAALGWRVSTGAVRVDGFPRRIVFSLPNPSVEDPTGNAWQGPPLTVVLPLFSPQRPHLEAPGAHIVTMKGRAPITLSAQSASADLLFDGHGPSEVSLALSAISAGLLNLDRLDLRWTRLADGPVAQDVASWKLQLAMDNLRLPEDPRLIFGTLLPSLRLESHLQGSLPGGSLDQALTAWRDAGGTLEIDSLSVEWPPLALSGKGTLALDRDLQPMLASSCDVRGLFEAIDALVRGGIVRAKDAGMVKLVFGLLMKPDKSGAKTLSVPVTIQDHALSVGPAKLLDLPMVTWH
jgi:hypothetical protein